MNPFNLFAPADAFWSIFGLAFAPARFLEGVDTAVASPPDRECNVPRGDEDARPVTSESVFTMLEDESSILEEPRTAYSGDRNRRTGTPQWISQHFDIGDERQQFKVYVPSSYGGQPLALIVMLHGAQQDPDDFAAGTGMNVVAEEKGYIVVYPEQSESANLLRCWNWFRPEDRTREVGESAVIAALTRHVMASYNVDDARVYVAGMSAGGAMAVNLAVTHPELYAGAAIHSGIAFGVADGHLSALCAMNDGKGKIRLPAPILDGTARHTVPLIVFHGDADDTVHPGNGEQIVAMSQMLHPDLDGTPAESMRIQPGAFGHASTRRVFRDQAGALIGEQWIVHGLRHAWSGGHPDGTYTDRRGPCATKEIVRFFEQVSRKLQPHENH
ncbi:polyhydroxybutyrate depolymerase domain-containing protein [Caballeronia fortuita]|uniref:Polyhydroxybutyrate depolymerase domain-containing protein n=1 Tax=Caballeronia fortuita TaxID=1777138 RepID=A0A158CME3_9BURK|nr:PHB depolymerase family esterase [Caballeronia fortuita]SAK83544.1 polyhydroxybutyrate depolymerase domain-containing protein [Caballeronia fortuita]